MRMNEVGLLFFFSRGWGFGLHHSYEAASQFRSSEVVGPRSGLSAELPLAAEDRKLLELLELEPIPH